MIQSPDGYVVGSVRHEAHKVADWQRLNCMFHGKFYPSIRAIFHKVMPRCIIDMTWIWPNDKFQFWGYVRSLSQSYNREMEDVHI